MGTQERTLRSTRVQADTLRKLHIIAAETNRTIYQVVADLVEPEYERVARQIAEAESKRQRGKGR